MVAGSAAAATSNRFSTEVVQPSAANAQALSNSNSNAAAGGVEAGASNQDLTKRLAELKGKLAALKKNWAAKLEMENAYINQSINNDNYYSGVNSYVIYLHHSHIVFDDILYIRQQNWLKI